MKDLSVVKSLNGRKIQLEKINLLERVAGSTRRFYEGMLSIIPERHHPIRLMPIKISAFINRLYKSKLVGRCCTSRGCDILMSLFIVAN
ncbi:hypothetical protein Sjap_017021 [Stephania japonica]|uniref:Uncharacterized protein n=1 Tax=Stephania japonica TaxID=461633 RepID=A0AAP0I5G4_9MAGN